MTLDVAAPLTPTLRALRPDDPRDAAAITRLHLALLGHGPMARLGELFLRRFCYGALVRDGYLEAALAEVGGRPAGFVSYTGRSITFHRDALRRRAPTVAGLLVLSVLRDPRVLGRLAKAVWLMRSRRAEQEREQDPLGEVLSIGVLPAYRAPQRRVSEALVAHAADALRRQGVDRMRMVVEAHNTATLLLYHRLGARFEPYEHAGQPMVQVWFAL